MYDSKGIHVKSQSFKYIIFMGFNKNLLEFKLLIQVAKILEISTKFKVESWD